MLQDKIPDRIGQTMNSSTSPSPSPTKRAGETDNMGGAPSAKRIKTGHGPDVEALPPPPTLSLVKNVSGIWGLSSFAILIVTSRLLYILFNDT
ncbi:hypothetical protein B0H21DRAFT_827052 [Amylocystis lapponica]|nr:hypothetical protein B0H21DRAFT_827052 [Amylocystis lapponica]